MVIGIDARFYGEAGPGRYIKNIIKHLEKLDTRNTYKIFLKKKNYDKYVPSNPNFVKVLADFQWYTWEEQLIYPMQLLLSNLDLLYIPHFNVPILYPKKTVTVIHDIIMHSFSTEEATTLPKAYYKFKKLMYFVVVYFALIKSKKVIVPSITTQEDIMHHYKFINASKFVLAYEGVDPDLLKQTNLNSHDVLDKYKIQKPFLLYVSSMYKHKNVERLISMFKILMQHYNFTGNLVIVGKKDAFSQQIEDLIKSQNMINNIKMPGQINYITDDEIKVLKKEALLYVFPSLKEGFSLTPLEAMAEGLPVALSSIPCHVEIFKDSAVFFDPLSVDDMASKVNSLILDKTLRDELSDKGKALVATYSFENTGYITLNTFESCLK